MRLKELREEKGVSQEELARAISSDPRSISRWELGQNAPTLPFVIALAKYFDCSLDFLAELVDEQGRAIPTDLPQRDKDLLKAFHKLGPFEQETVLIQINALAEKMVNDK